MKLSHGIELKRSFNLVKSERRNDVIIVFLSSPSICVLCLDSETLKADSPRAVRVISHIHAIVV